MHDTRKRTPHPAVLADMTAAYRAGASIRQIAAEYGGSYCWTRLRLLDAGVRLRGRGGFRNRT